MKMKKDGMKKDGVMKSRRKFIKKLGGAALGAAAASAVPTIAGAAQGATTQWASTYDWVCIGAGTAGCTAAIFGHDKGFKTLLFEKSKTVGGGSAQGAGILYVPMNSLMKAAGIPDSRDKALDWLRYVSAGYNSPEHMATFVDNAPRAIDYLREKADVSLRISELIDFWSPFSAGGWRVDESMDLGPKQGRCLTAQPFPAEQLGNWRDKVDVCQWYVGLGEALEGQEHNPSLGRLTKGASLGPHIGYSGPARNMDSLALKLWKKRLGSKLDPLLKKDEEQRIAGAGLVAYLMRAILKRGIEVQTESEVDRLLVENGRVVGVTVNRGGKEEHIRANKGVVVATGGGTSWRLAAEVRGDVYSATGFPSLPGLQVPGEPSNRANYEARMRHSLIVNRFGERVGNEVPYQGIAGRIYLYDSHGEHRFVNVPTYYICDSQVMEKYSFLGRPPGETEGLEWIAQGKTLAELAQKLKMSAVKLEATVARFNEYARKGNDADFHRRPETLGALEKPPFYGLVSMEDDRNPLRAGVTIVMNTRGQVPHYSTGKPIPGLYASGNISQHSLIWGVGYQAGLGQAAGITFSLLAAEHAASV